MNTLFDLVREVQTARANNSDALGVEYFSESNPSNRHYVVLRNEQEFKELKDSYKEWDFIFNRIAYAQIETGEIPSKGFALTDEIN